MKQPAVYMLASQRNGTLYVGVTSNLVQRVWQHKNHVVPGFTEKYQVGLLVWFEQHATMESAITREKAIKKWLRAWKLNLIEKTNPEWTDLWPVITGEALDSRLRGNDESGQVPVPSDTLASSVTPAPYVIAAPLDIPASSVIPYLFVIPAPPVIPAKAGIQKVPPK